MGDLESYSALSSSPIYIVIMRNSRGKPFIYVAILLVLCFIVFLLSSTHNNLKELEGVNEKCNQQRDSLSAQLQVVYEHKNRLEKSLQQEKTDHRHTKEENEKQLHELENKIQEEKEKEQRFEDQISQLKSKYSNLEEEKAHSENVLSDQLKSVSAQKDKEIEKLQNHITELLSEKDKLETTLNSKQWKLDQIEQDLTLCQEHLLQARTDLNNCRISNNKDISPKPVISEKKEDNKNVNEAEIKHLPAEIVAKNDLKVQEQIVTAANKSTLMPAAEKKVFSKPHVLPQNNAVDGVIQKPEDVDAAVEDAELKKADREAKAFNMNEQDLNLKLNLLQDDKKEPGEGVLKGDAQKEAEQHPQVLPPNNFDVGEKDDHAGERGEYGVQQYGLADKPKHQVELPVFDSKPLGRRKNLMPVPQQVNNNDIDAQKQDMMNKSPGDINAFQGHHKNPNRMVGAIDMKIHQLKNDDGLLQREGNGIDDKNYEEDDDDRENDDDQGNGLIPDLKPHPLQDNDFDDQENADNAKEEGVMAAPK